MAILEDPGRDDAGNEFIYEVDENGVRELVRSVHSNLEVFIRYTNVTSRPVNVWWRDFRGFRRFYARLKPTEFCDINTYATHPWEFTDEATGERYNVGDRVIFRAPVPRDGGRYRCNWNISVCLRTLRDTALLQVALSMQNTEEVASLGLPKLIADDVKNLVHVIKSARPIREDSDEEDHEMED